VTVSPTGITRPYLAHLPEDVWPAHRETAEVVITFDLRPGGRYVTAECQLGAHHACPGGLRTATQMPIAAYRCRCVADGCACKPTQQVTK
jgi:hypothetical protein